MRYASIDLLRTAAITLMVIVHFLENLAGAGWAPAGFGAPLFALLVGVSFQLWVRGQEQKGASEGDITRTAVRRGLFLFALGFAFNVLVWLPEDTFNWDVLTMLGTSLVFLGLGRNLPPVVLAVVAATLVVLSPFLRAQADYLEYWREEYFQCDWTLSDVSLGFLATGYFPLFPWAAFPLAGYLVGRSVFVGDTPTPSVKPVAVAGSVLQLTAVVMDIGHRLFPAPVSSKVFTGWTMFPASPEYVCGTLGGALLAFALLHAWVDRRNSLAKVPWLTEVAGTMSRHSLSAYLLHHVFHLWPLWVCGLVGGEEPTEYWRNAMPAWAAVALVPPCLVICFLTFRVAERWKWPTVESFMRWLCG